MMHRFFLTLALGLCTIALWAAKAPIPCPRTPDNWQIFYEQYAQKNYDKKKQVSKTHSIITYASFICVDIPLHKLSPKVLNTVELDLIARYAEVCIVGTVTPIAKNARFYPLFAYFVKDTEGRVGMYSLQGELICAPQVGHVSLCYSTILVGNTTDDFTNLSKRVIDENNDYNTGMTYGWAKALYRVEGKYLYTANRKAPFVVENNLIPIIRPGEFDAVALGRGSDVLTYRFQNGDTLCGLYQLDGTEMIACKYKGLEWNRDVYMYVPSELTPAQIAQREQDFLQQEYALRRPTVKELGDLNNTPVIQQLKEQYPSAWLSSISKEHYLGQTEDGVQTIYNLYGEKMCSPLVGSTRHLKGVMLIGDKSTDFDEPYPYKKKLNANSLYICYGIGDCQAVLTYNPKKYNQSRLIITPGRYDGISYLPINSETYFYVYKRVKNKILWGLCNDIGIELIPCLYNSLEPIGIADVPFCGNHASMSQFYKKYSRKSHLVDPIYLTPECHNGRVQLPHGKGYDPQKNKAIIYTKTNASLAQAFSSTTSLLADKHLYEECDNRLWIMGKSKRYYQAKEYTALQQLMGKIRAKWLQYGYTLPVSVRETQPSPYAAPTPKTTTKPKSKRK